MTWFCSLNIKVHIIHGHTISEQVLNDIDRRHIGDTIMVFHGWNWQIVPNWVFPWFPVHLRKLLEVWNISLLEKVVFLLSWIIHNAFHYSSLSLSLLLVHRMVLQEVVKLPPGFNIWGCFLGGKCYSSISILKCLSHQPSNSAPTTPWGRGMFGSPVVLHRFYVLKAGSKVSPTSCWRVLKKFG